MIDRITKVFETRDSRGQAQLLIVNQQKYNKLYTNVVEVLITAPKKFLSKIEIN